MPKHGTGLGAASFPAANKLLMRYEAERAYRMHQQKIANVKPRIDKKAPQKQNHLVLRLKQIQKEEERQAEIDHENKLLLAKMTNVMKYGGNIDNWNNYESRSLNYPFREKMNEDIARENIGIARRLETVRPKLQINAWEKDYTKHKYLKRLWNDSVKDFGLVTPRRFQSRMSHAVKRSLETSLDDTYEEDNQSYDTNEDRKLPKLRDKQERSNKARHNMRQTKSETNGPTSSRKEKEQKRGGEKSASRFPSINNRALVEHDYSMYYGSQSPRSPRVAERVSLVRKSEDEKQRNKGNKHQVKKKTDKNKNSDTNALTDKASEDIADDNISDDEAEHNDTDCKSQASFKSANAIQGNDLERVKTLISEEADKASDNEMDDKEGNGSKAVSVAEDVNKDEQDNDVGKTDETSVKDAAANDDNKADDGELEKKSDDLTQDGNGKVDDTKEKSQEKVANGDESRTEDGQMNVDDNDPDADGGSQMNGKQIKGDSVKGSGDDELNTKRGNNDTTKEENEGEKDLGNKCLSVPAANKDDNTSAAENHEGQEANNVNEIHDTNEPEGKVLSNGHLPQSNSSTQEQDKDQEASSGDNNTFKNSNKDNNSDKAKSVTPDKAETEKDSEHVTDTSDEAQDNVPDGNGKNDDNADGSASERVSSVKDTTDSGSLKVDSERSPSGRGKAKSVKPASRERRMNSSGRASAASKDGSKWSRTKASKEDGVTNNKETGQEDKSDLAQLFKAAKQLGKPQDIIIRTLIKKTHKQRMGIKAKFRKKYDLDLITELKQGLGQKWENLIDALLQERGVADAYAAFDALSVKKNKQGKRNKQTSDFSDVVELLSSRRNTELAELKEAYRKEFSLSMEEDIADRTIAPIQTLLLILQKGDRDEGQEVDENAAKKDAVALYESGEGRWESDNGKFLMLLNSRSFAHIHAVFAEYKMVAEGQEVIDAMKKECSKEYFLVLQSLVRNISSPADHFATQLHKHKQPTNPVLINILVVRSEIDLPQIRKAYKRHYHVDITDDIKNVPHPTQQCLVELALKGSVGKSKNTETKKSVNTKGSTTGSSHSKPASKKQTNQRPVEGSEQQKSQTEQNSKSEEHKNQPAKASDNHIGAERGSQKTEPKSEATQKEKVVKKVGGGVGGASKDTQKVKEKKDGEHNGTVKPTANFKPEDDCQKLNAALSEDGVNDQVIVSIIPRRSNKQRQQLKLTYEQMYKKNLMIDLESELNGDLEEMVLALMMPPDEYDAYVIHEAVEGLGTSESTLIGILATRTGREMNKIAACYKKAYRTDLELDVTRDSQGDFQTLLIQLCKGQRDEGTAVNMAQAKQDAQLLYKDGQLDIYGETFLNLLSRKNSFQVKATFEEYKRVSGEDIYTGIRKAGLQDDEDGYISIVQAVEDPVLFYSQKIEECIKNMRTSDNILIRIIVSRSEVDLKEIKERYSELYGQSLYSVMDQKCKADHKALLLAILDK